MVLSNGLIYFGFTCLLLAIFLIWEDHKSLQTTKGNKKLYERIQFYKNKWQKEHIGLVFWPVWIILACVVLAMITESNVFLYLSGLILLGGYIYLYNRMMGYVETYAFGPENEGREISQDE